MHTINAVLLDLDGTLLDSVPDLAIAANAIRRDLGMAQLPEALVATFVGKGVDNLVRRALAGSLDGAAPDEALFARGRLSFFKHYHAVNGAHATVFDGVKAGLAAMREQGLPLAVVTNKPTEFTLPLLERTGLAGFFRLVVCGDTCARRKPDPDQVLHACDRLGVAPAQAVTIGDSVNDALAGRRAGTAVLAVPYGYNEGMDVRSLDVDGIVDTLVDAAHWISQRNAKPQRTTAA
ncbi:phosphoglycolate phosphatase [Bordetella pertussis]|uniref:Phosphoglycolate phosphatase n=4 Tax=Bordetella pertussis TaxID=520 RepID=Q7VU63_BORPE|nr:phosphoglycolate phosphatase [Bordetella pertussis]ETH39234.1 phosphoglycolate phosphatase [Bordetella pertussis H918]ETH42795.1 phosphoglycolate phosphatase [Bordetella pertussis H939]ETH46507.1 phosphoglycolate phosphatase [Bordetella pertussis H921]ETH73022.1 phosphoglycolate phosphatase [Bordetella pertussis STO1-CHLA-0011]ETH83652.1 phosphoglycolate phosphatase [Bordetella pertussis STO1-CHOC-0017]ETH85306.1 phosphoglycolate phosphatase [Bordetella pertussis STO1-CHOC-0018]ETH91117.1